jgi:hypothetical protein
MSDGDHVDERLMRGDQTGKLAANRAIRRLDLGRLARDLARVKDAEADPVAQEVRARCAVHREGDRPVCRPLDCPGPGEVDVVLDVFGGEADGEGVAPILDLERGVARLDRVPIPVPHRHIEPAHDLDVAGPHVPEIAVLQHGGQLSGA